MSGDGNLALFCDFENVALGVRNANKAAKFDIQLILARLLLKGSIVVKKAYCDWDRYKDFKAQMHGAAFELIEIPMYASRARTRRISAWSSMPWISATPRRISTPSSSSRAIPISRRW